MDPVINQPPPYGQPSGTTTVVISQPGLMNMQGSRNWSSDLCGCVEDMESCCCTFLCYNCYLSHLYGRYDESCCVPWCVCPFGALMLRVQHRARHQIVGTMMNDVCTSCFCGLCLMCQLKRDMDYTEQTKGSLR